jgi:hypothetical protein
MVRAGRAACAGERQNRRRHRAKLDGRLDGDPRQARLTRIHDDERNMYQLLVELAGMA